MQDSSGKTGHPKDYGINTSPQHKANFYSVSFWSAKTPVSLRLQMHVILFFHLKCIVMSASFPFPGRRRRQWVSFLVTGCHHSSLVHVVYRCPVIAGVPLVHLAWVHRIVPAS